MKFTQAEAEAFIWEQHNKYYALLQDWNPKDFLPIPNVSIIDAVFNACGMYRADLNQVSYSIPYCCLAGEEYAETVAHEMAHAFQRHIDPDSKSHGPTWRGIMQNVLHLPANVYHNYDIREALRIAEELRKRRKSNTSISGKTYAGKSLRELLEIKKGIR